MPHTETDPAALYVKVLPVTEVKAGDVVRYSSRGSRPTTLSMTVDRVVDCGPVDDPDSSRHGQHVILLMGEARKLDGQPLLRNGWPSRRLTTLWDGQRLDVLRPLSAEELAVRDRGLVTE